MNKKILTSGPRDNNDNDSQVVFLILGHTVCSHPVVGSGDLGWDMAAIPGRRHCRGGLLAI